MSLRSSIGRSLMPALLAVGVACCPATAEAARKAGELVVETRSLTTSEGEVVPYEIGAIFVPENRDAPDGRLIAVGYARIRGAQQGAPTPPTFHLSGGPGSSYLGMLTNDAPAWRARLTELLRYRGAGDVVLIDQRGFSIRGDMLVYAYPPWDAPLDRPASAAAERDAQVALAKAAIAAHPDKDLSGYTLVQCVEDLNDLRRALGYGKINLVGQSFGSQWSFAVMRLHPEIVERALLSGVEPLDAVYDMPSHVFAALQRTAWEADQDPGLKPYLPRGGLMAATLAVRDRLAAGPIAVPVRDAATGKVRTVTLGLADFQRDLIEADDGWPTFVLSLHHRQYEAWARTVLAARRAGSDGDALIGPLIDTSLGVSAEREHQLRTDPATEILGSWGFDSYISAAPAWPTPDLGDDLRRPTPSEIPVLFVHGDWDTSTPIENTFGVLPYFPNGRAMIVRRAGHGARFLVMAQWPEVRGEILEFLRDGDTKGLPVLTSLPTPRFRPPAFPPPARRGAGT